jgi:hypothetical protein
VPTFVPEWWKFAVLWRKRHKLPGGGRDRRRRHDHPRSGASHWSRREAVHVDVTLRAA